MKAYSPMVAPHTMVALAPMLAPRFTSVGAYSSFRLTSERGFTTLVKTAEGPTNTWSSSVTPSYTETLFWMRTPSPIVTFPM
jgi:hypothetical protein